MNWNFPEIMTTRNINQRIKKVLEELNEFKNADNQQHRDEEAVDVLHSVETLLREQFKGREEALNIIINKVLLKNTNRGYYCNKCF